MLVYNFTRALFFIVFSSVGILTIGFAMLLDEWQDLYQTKTAIAQIQKSNEKIAQLINDHDELIQHIKTDPNMIQRLVPVTLGEDINESNLPPAKITTAQLARARGVLNEPDSSSKVQCPQWLQRCAGPQAILVLFVAGAGLIVTSFGCFCRKSKPDPKKASKA